jgi:putative membrane protein
MRNRNLNFMTCVVCAAVFFAACNSNGSVKEVNSINPGTDSSNASGKASIAGADTAFMAKAADAGIMEINLGTYASQNSKNQQVKDFGSMMITDHTKAADELKGIASAENVALPAALTADHQKMVDKMKQKSGNDFDKDYIDMMVSDHKEVIDAFQDEAKSGKDSTVAAFASGTLPVLQKHVESAKTVQQGISKNQ